MAPDTSSSTTRSRRAGRPHGQPQAERRLKRELANREAILGLVDAGRSIAAEFTHAALANPVIGLASAIVAVDLLHRTRVISDLAFAAALASIGAVEISSIITTGGAAAANVVGAIGNIVPKAPFSGSSTFNPAQIIDLIAPSNNQTDARGGFEAKGAAFARKIGLEAQIPA